MKPVFSGVGKIRKLISLKGKLWSSYKMLHTGAFHKLQYTKKSVTVELVNLKHDEKMYVLISTRPSENKITFNL